MTNFFIIVYHKERREIHMQKTITLKSLKIYDICKYDKI